MADASDRTLPATPRRRELARRQGAMPTASLPAWAASAGTALLLLPWWAGATLPAAAGMVREAIRTGSGGTAAAADAAALLPGRLLLPTVGLVLATAAAGLAVRLLLDGPSWQPGRVAPDLGRISPLAGFARIFSAGTVAAILGNGLGLAVLVAAATSAAGPLVALVAAPEGVVEPAQAWPAARRTLLALAAASAGVGACHWMLARMRFERRIRMTPQEFADEARSMQADPKVRLLQQQRRRYPAAGTS